ncbi:phage tail assembly chaperone [Shinella zoogloeoides]
MYERFGQEALIQEPEIPEEGEHLWEWFWHLSGRRMQGMDGPLALTYPEIRSWSEMTGEVLLREEMAVLIGMDDAYLSALAKEREAQREANKKP